MKQIRRRGQLPALVFFLVLMIASVGTAGCIKLVGKATDSQTGGAMLAPPSVSDYPQEAFLLDAVPPGAAWEDQAGAQVPADKVSVVTDAAPIVNPDPYPVLHGVRFDPVPDNTHEDRIFEFTKTVPLRGNATGLLVDVDQPPLIMTFSVDPQNDCIANPADCRGSLAHPVQRPHFTMTVRENATGQVVLEDGYGREFSSEKENRTVRIYRGGTYHITLAGEFLDVSLGIATGASPRVSEVLAQNGTIPDAAMTSLPSDNQYWY